MRRSERIKKYLDEHPRANVQALEKKFDLSFREARHVWATHYGLSKVSEGTDSRLMKFFQRAGKIFSADFSEKKVLIFLVGLAALVRLGYLYFFSRQAVLHIPILDAEYYLAWAKAIVEHGLIGDKVFFTEPFYAYLLAFFLKLFGSTFGGTVLIGFQFILGALFPALLFIIGRTFFSRAVALVAGVLAALYGPFAFYDSLLLKTSLEVYTLPLFLLVIWHAFERPRQRTFFLSGLLLGAIALMKGNALIFAPLTLWFIFHFLKAEGRAIQLKFAGLFLAGLFLCILPVTVRNYAVGHDLVPTNYSIGLVLYQGNWWGGDGSTARVPTFLRPHPKFEERDAVGMAESFLGHTLKPSEVSRFWMNQTFTEIVAAPSHFLATLWNKLLLLMNYREYSDNYSYAFYRSFIPFLWLLPGYYFVLIGGGTGLILIFFRTFEETIFGEHRSEIEHARFRRTKLLLLSFFIAYAGVLLLTTINARYRMPLVPFLILFTAAMLVYCFECARERSWFRIRNIFFGAGLFLLITILPLSIFRRVSFADAYNNIAQSFLEAGDYRTAEEYFDKAIHDDDQYAWSYGGLVHIAFLEQRYDDVEGLLKKLILIRPDDLGNYEELRLLKQVRTLPEDEARTAVVVWFAKANNEQLYDSDFYEASRFLNAGDDAQALPFLLASLEKHETSLSPLVMLAALKNRHNDTLSAKRYLQQALAQNPDVFPVRYNLANVFIKENNYGEVVNLLKEVYEFTPELGEVWYNYVVALVKEGKTAEAVPIMQAYVERYKDDTSRVATVKKFQDALKPSTPSLEQTVKNGLKQ